MKVLLCTDRYYPAISGVVTSVMTLKKYLEALGHDVKVLTLSDDKSSHSSDDVIYIGSFDARMIYPDTRIKHPVSRSRLEGLIKWSPDVIHCNTEFSTFFLAKHIYHACGCPMVLTYHTDYEDYVHYLALSKKIGRFAIKAFMHYVSRYMTYVVCPTDKTMKLLNNYRIKKPIRIIPTGLDLERFLCQQDEEKIADLKKQYGIKENLSTLVYVGRLGKEKNLNEIISYLEHHSDRNFQFVIVGDGPDRKELEKHVSDSNIRDKVIFTGLIPHEDIAIFYHLGDLFLSASTSETQGLTYIEAMAAGTPLLCRKDRCLEGVVEDGYNSYLFENEDEFHKRLVYHFTHKEIWPEIRKKAQEKVIEKFGARKFATDILALYNDAIRDYRPHRSPLSFLWHKVMQYFPWV